jgi:Putative Actinobacterial Holin-X, holin superfamily III
VVFHKAVTFEAAPRKRGFIGPQIGKQVDIARGNGETDAEDRSVAELVRELSDQASALARKEVELAKAEMTIKAKRLGIGAGAFGGAATVGLFALGALTATFILALATAVEPWLAALIVTAAYAAIAGVLALTGRQRVQAGTPPVPEQAIDSTKEDIERAKRSAKEVRA